jgi:hypothetical protein
MKIPGMMTKRCQYNKIQNKLRKKHKTKHPKKTFRINNHKSLKKKDLSF